MSEPIPAGSTDQTIDVFLQDSSSTTGAGLTGLVYNTSGLTCYYRKGATGSSTQLTLATQTVGGAHSDGGFVEIDSTNQPGMYRLDLSDTIVASEGYVTIYIQGAANLLATPIRVDVVSATRGLAGTALPAAAADAAGGLVISDAGGLDIDNRLVSATATAALEDQYDGTGLTGDTYPATQAQVGNIAIAGAAINTVVESYLLTTGTQSSGTYTDTQTLDGTLHEHTDTAGAMELYYQFDLGADGVPTSTKFVGRLNGANDSLGVYAYNWTGTSWDQIGTLSGTNGATNETNTYDLLTAHVGTGGNAGLVRIRYYAASGLTTATLRVDQILVSYVDPSAAAIRAEIDSNSTKLAAILADTNELQTDDVPGLIASLNDLSAADVLTTALTESYSADGAAPTLTQAVMLILQHLSESSISGTTKTVKKLDGSTTAATFTLDDATTPTSVTRAT